MNHLPTTVILNINNPQNLFEGVTITALHKEDGTFPKSSWTRPYAQWLHTTVNTVNFRSIVGQQKIEFWNLVILIGIAIETSGVFGQF